MSSTSKTMLVTTCRAKRSCAASRRKPLNPHCVSLTGPVTQIDASTWKTLPSSAAVTRLRRTHVRPIRLDPRTKGNVVVDEGAQQVRDLIGRRRHIGIREDHEVAGSGEHASTDGGAFAAMWNATDVQPHALDRCPPPRVVPRRGRRSRLCCRRRRRGPRCPPAAPSGWAPPPFRRRVVGGSRTARRAPGRSVPPR